MKASKKMSRSTGKKGKRFCPYRDSPFAKRMPAAALNIDFSKLHPAQQANKMGINIIECLACNGNRPSTYNELALHRARLYPEEKATVNKIKDLMNQWTLDCLKYGMEGLQHEGEERPDYFGYKCMEKGPHVICKSKTGYLKEIACWIDEDYLPIFNQSGANTYPTDSKACFAFRGSFRKGENSEDSTEEQQSRVLPSPPVSEFKTTDSHLEVEQSSSSSSISSFEFDESMPATPPSTPSSSPPPFASPSYPVYQVSLSDEMATMVPVFTENSEDLPSLFTGCDTFADNNNFTDNNNFETVMPIQVVQSLEQLFADDGNNGNNGNNGNDYFYSYDSYDNYDNTQNTQNTQSFSQDQEEMDFWRELGVM